MYNSHYPCIGDQYVPVMGIFRLQMTNLYPIMGTFIPFRTVFAAFYMPYKVLKCLQMPKNTHKCHQMLTNTNKYQQNPTNAFKCLQIRTRVVELSIYLARTVENTLIYLKT